MAIQGKADLPDWWPEHVIPPSKLEIALAETLVGGMMASLERAAQELNHKDAIDFVAATLGTLIEISTQQFGRQVSLKIANSMIAHQQMRDGHGPLKDVLNKGSAPHGPNVEDLIQKAAQRGAKKGK